MELTQIVLTKEQWNMVREEALDIATSRGYDYNDALKLAEERVRKALSW